MKAFILVILDLMYKFLIYSDIFYFKDYSKFLFLFFEKISKLNKLMAKFPQFADPCPSAELLK